jgi:hypothetical protein
MKCEMCDEKEARFNVIALGDERIYGLCLECIPVFGLFFLDIKPIISPDNPGELPYNGRI